MTHEKSVSVAMATYNGEQYLRPQLDSIVEQTYQPTELVVCDDGSTDDTLNIIQTFAKTVEFDVRIHRNSERLGHRKNFLQCAKLCHGDLIAFCDQDDIWLKDKLSTQTAHFLQHSNTLLTFHNAALIDHNDLQLGRTLYTEHRARCFSLNNISKYAISYGLTQMFRRELLLFADFMLDVKNMFIPGEMITHDHWFFLLALIFGQVHYDPTCLARYRRHATNASPPGVIPPATLHEKIRRKLNKRDGQFDRMIDVWTNWRDVIKAISNMIEAQGITIDGCDAPLRSQNAIAIFDEIIEVTERRRRLSNTKSKLRKLDLLAQSVYQGDYNPATPWRNPPLALAREFVKIFYAPIL